MTQIDTVARTFLESAAETVDKILAKRFDAAQLTPAQREAMNHDQDYLARRNAMLVDKALTESGSMHGTIARAIIQLILQAELEKVYQGFLPEGEEYDSLFEYIDTKLGRHMSSDLLARYCRAVETILVPMAIIPIEIPVATRIRLLEQEQQQSNGDFTRQDELDALLNGTSDPAYADPFQLIERVSNIKSFKELPYLYEQLEPGKQADVVAAMWEGHSAAKVKSLATKLVENVDDGDDTQKKTAKTDKPVLYIKVHTAADGREINDLILRDVPPWFTDTVTALLGDMVTQRFETES